MKILIDLYHGQPPYVEFPEDCFEELKGLFPEHEFIKIRGDEALAVAIRIADAYIGWELKEEFFNAAKNLKWIQFGHEWLGGMVLPQMVDSEVILTNTRGCRADSVSEHAWGMALQLTRKLNKARRFQDEVEWNREYFIEEMPMQVSEGTLGLIGIGEIGQRLARVGKLGFNMNVLAYKWKKAESIDHITEIFYGKNLAMMMEQSDVVINSLPLTKHTKGIIGKNEFLGMNPKGVFISVGQNGTFNEQALTDALENGEIAGAALDMIDNEPLDPESPLWKMENVIISPRYAGITPRFWANFTRLIKQNIRKLKDDEPVLINEVDKKNAY